MTAKEKALSLCQQFGSTTKFAEDCNEGKTLPLRVAKLCAMIAVDEILNSRPCLPICISTDGGSSEALIDANNFWIIVKIEIERM